MEHKAAIVVLHFLIEAVLVFFFGLISVPSIIFQFFHSGFRSFHLSTLSKLYFKVGNIYVQWWLPLNSFLYNYFESCKVVSVNSIGPKSASSSHKRYLSSCSVSLCKGYSSYWQRGYASPIFLHQLVSLLRQFDNMLFIPFRRLAFFIILVGSFFIHFRLYNQSCYNIKV